MPASIHQRNQRIVDNMLSAARRAIAGSCQHVREQLDLGHSPGRKGSDESRSYDFGNTYSRPAIVVDGKVVLVG